jgi:hypothetical protein
MGKLNFIVLYLKNAYTVGYFAQKEMQVFMLKRWNSVFRDI